MMDRVAQQQKIQDLCTALQRERKTYLSHYKQILEGKYLLHERRAYFIDTVRWEAGCSLDKFRMTLHCRLTDPLGNITERRQEISFTEEMTSLATENPLGNSARVITHQGLMSFESNGFEHELLGISCDRRCIFLAEQIAEDIYRYGSKLSINYWTSDEETDAYDLNPALKTEIDGQGKAEYEMHGDELQGHLWTDESIKVGDFDLLSELKKFAGKWLYLEIRHEF